VFFQPDSNIKAFPSNSFLFGLAMFESKALFDFASIIMDLVDVLRSDIITKQPWDFLQW